MNAAYKPWLGICLALLAAVFWGAMPIAMKQVLPVMKPQTIVWYRFAIAVVGLGVILTIKGTLPSIRLFCQRRRLILLMVAALGLCGNFVLFSSSLQYISPTAAQVIAQLSPVGMVVASVLVLKEKMCLAQVLGTLLLISGLMLFFNQNLFDIVTRLTDCTMGILLGVCAAAVWVCYGVAQKVLLKQLGSQQLLFLLYALCTILLLPMVSFDAILHLNGWQLVCLLFCGLNTLIGYGALAEAMALWKAAPVSALLTLTPLFTLLFSDALALILPEWFSLIQLNWLGYVGVVVVAVGAISLAAGHWLLLSCWKAQSS